jgi:hypothetical protein
MELVHSPLGMVSTFSEECRKGKSQGNPPVTRQSSSNENEQVDSRTGLNKQLLAHLAELSIQDE